MESISLRDYIIEGKFKTINSPFVSLRPRNSKKPCKVPTMKSVKELHLFR